MGPFQTALVDKQHAVRLKRLPRSEVGEPKLRMQATDTARPIHEHGCRIPLGVTQDVTLVGGDHQQTSLLQLATGCTVDQSERTSDVSVEHQFLRVKGKFAVRYEPAVVVAVEIIGSRRPLQAHAGLQRRQRPVAEVLGRQSEIELLFTLGGGAVDHGHAVQRIVALHHVILEYASHRLLVGLVDDAPGVPRAFKAELPHPASVSVVRVDRFGELKLQHVGRPIARLAHVPRFLDEDL